MSRSAIEIEMAARHAAAALAGVEGGVWENFCCSEVDALAELMVAVGRVDDAVTLIFRHSHADSEENEDRHAEIGEAARAQAKVTGIEWTERDGYKLAAVYVASEL